MQKDPNNSNNGGSGNSANPPKKEAKKASEVVIELQQAKTELYNLVRRLPKPKNDNIIKKLDEANEELHNFSQGNLIKQIEEQHKKLTEEILAEANLREENQKQIASDALQNYFNKRIELARIRQQEINQEDKQMMDAATYVCSYFDTPEGIRQHAMNEADQKKQSEMMNKVISELGNKHNHIHRTEGMFFKTKHIVKLENGVYTSESPVDLAMTVKAHGHNDFEFSTGSTEKGGWVLRQSIKEMLKVGIKDISLTKELREKMYTPRRANNFADAILENRRTLSYFEMEDLRQLERICNASRSAYNDIKGNNIFDEKGDIKADAKCAPAIIHQANTFMRLTDEKDRLAYLEILFPVNKDVEYNQMVKELESRTPKITLDGLSPKEYFEQKLMWRWNRSAFNAEYRKEQLAAFNKDTMTSAERMKSYLETKDAEMLSMYAQSDKLTTDNRIELVNTLFDNVQEGKSSQVAFYTHPILRTRSVSTDDMKNFMDRILPLIKHLVIKENNVIDYQATTEQCTKLIADLRQKAKLTFAEELHANNPRAFENFYKNKLLLDNLEKEVHQYLHDDLTDKQVKAEIGAAVDQYDATIQSKREALKLTLSKPFTDLKSNPNDPEAAATYFITHLHPELQLSEWSKLSSADNDSPAEKAGKLELRAHIVKAFLVTHQTSNSPVSADYVNKFLKPLMQQLTPAESKDLATKLQDLLRPTGCNKAQNEAINLVRATFNDRSAIETLSPENLFKAYYSLQNTPKAKADALKERIQFLLKEKPANLFTGWMFNRTFDAEMKDLLFSANQDKAATKEIIDELKADGTVAKDSDLDIYIQRLDQMQGTPPAAAPNDGQLDLSAVHSGDEDTDSESVEMRKGSHHDFDEEHHALAPRPTFVGVD